MKKVTLILLVASFSFLSLAFVSNDNFSYSNKAKDKKVNLTLNARENGFKVIEERQKIYVQAINVFDPIEKKRVEGEGKLRITCDEKKQLQTYVDALFDNGKTGRILTPCRNRNIQRILALVKENSENQ